MLNVGLTKFINKLTMKKYLFTLSVFGVLQLAAMAQPELAIDRTVHDYGTLTQGANTQISFTLTNTGTEAIVLQDVHPSCGCTIPEWSKEPIQPGDSLEVPVTYDSKRLGVINKTITITSNASNGTLVFRIKGEVVPETSLTPEVEESEFTPTADE